MFDYKHYTPILKWKTAEKVALEKLSIKEKKFITPLIQFVFPQPSIFKKNGDKKTFEEIFEEASLKFTEKSHVIPEEIFQFWGNEPIFIDYSLILPTDLKIQSFKNTMAANSKFQLALTPVVNLSSDEETQNEMCGIVKQYNSGLCLRLVNGDIADLDELQIKITDFLNKYNFKVNQIDLIVDLQETYKNEMKYQELTKINRLPYLLEWRTFILASGAFPVDLSKCELGDNYIPRLDWKNWLKKISLNELTRKPAYSDYTIQHPIYKEAFNFFSPSASIRYTLNDNWLVMRGLKGKSEHYLANAKGILDTGEFRGQNFSFGDNFIFEKGKDINSKKTGNATNWLTAGVNHHISQTIEQISNLV